MPIRALIFDLDGVLTDTARLHAAAWKSAFDPLLLSWYSRRSELCLPFDIANDYRLYVDGRPRYQGAAAFLESRGIHLPMGSPGDPPGWETVSAVANEKNRMYGKLIEERGVPVDVGMVNAVQAARREGLRTAVATSSRNGSRILRLAGIDELFDTTVDGQEIDRLHLHGKPSPDMFQHAAELLGVAPHDAAVIEDAAVGIEAAVRGGFGAVVGVAHDSYAEEQLVQSGATAIIHQANELLPSLGIYAH